MVWSFFTNPWTIGIGGGIISGIIVYFGTNYVVSKRENKLYVQKTNQANAELIQTLKPYVSSKKQLSIELFNSITASISKKHGIESNDILSLEEALNEIITDIMQTPFLTEEQKEAYSKKLLSTKKIPNQKEKIVYFKGNEYQSISSKSFSSVLAATTALIVMLTSLSFSARDSVSTVFSTQKYFFGAVTIIPIMVAVFFMFLDMQRRTLRMKKRRNEEEMKLKKSN